MWETEIHVIQSANVGSELPVQMTLHCNADGELEG